MSRHFFLDGFAFSVSYGRRVLKNQTMPFKTATLPLLSDGSREIIACLLLKSKTKQKSCEITMISLHTYYTDLVSLLYSRVRTAPRSQELSPHRVANCELGQVMVAFWALVAYSSDQEIEPSALQDHQF